MNPRRRRVVASSSSSSMIQPMFITAAALIILLTGSFQPNNNVVTAFQVSPQMTRSSQTCTRVTGASTTTASSTLVLSSGSGFGSDNNSPNKKKKNKPASSKSPSSAAGDFAFQEMLVYFNAMQKEGATSRTMDPTKRNELEGFVRTVLSTRGTGTIRLQDIGQAIVPKSSWKLMFSTSEAVLESLPNDATVYLNILDEENLDYILQFSKKTMGLNSLTAKCKYTFDTGPVQPGLLTFVYDKITTNVMGLSNIGVGFFGLLKGRVNYVESSYFDGTFWIEKGMGDGGEFINVYMRMDEP